MSRVFSDDMAVHAKRERVAEMYLRGMKQHEIAERENTTQQTICRDLAAIRKAWRASAVRDFDEYAAQQLEKIDLLERNYWEAWERSRSERTRSKTRRRTGAQPYDEASVEKEQRDGNPAFLDGVMKCIERRCKLLGLDAPEELNVKLDVEQRRHRLASLLASLRERQGAGAIGSAPGDN